MKLPWWLWVVVGLPVLVMSSLADIPFFMIVGLVFLVVGTAKLVFLFVLSPRSSKGQDRIVSRQLKGKSCPRCLSPVFSDDFYCRTCGTKLRKT